MKEMANSPAVSVIAPLFNEEENVPILQSELRATLSGLDHEIVFVDDGSVDHTVEQIETAPNIRVIRFEKNTGQSAAIYAGLQAARGATAVLIANAVRSRFTKDGVRDTGCTLKAMRRECVSALVPFKGMHRFIPALVKGAGYRLVEIPVNHRPRRFGESKYGLGNRALRATIDMFGVRWLLARRLNHKIRER
jgi:glycosyltransferase involved in cell wall biosynthesis